MWDMDYTMPTLVLLAIIAGAFIGRKRLPITSNKIFADLLYTDLLTMFLDYLSAKMDNVGNRFSDPVLWLANYLFFGFFLARSFYFFRFPAELLNTGGKKDSRYAKIVEYIFIAEEGFLLIGCLTGWIFSIHNGVYQSGVLYPFINIQFIVWIILALLLTFTAEESVRIRKTGIYLYLAILFCGVLLRALLPHIVIMNIFCLFAIQIVYLLYLNPDQYIDNLTLLFNTKGWTQFLDERSGQKAIPLVGFGIRNYAGLRQMRGSLKSGYGLQQIATWISHKWPDLTSFYLGNGIFILAGTRPFDQDAVLKEISARFGRPWSSENGDYYISINEMFTKPDLVLTDREVFKNTLQDTYHFLTQSEALEPICIDSARIRKQIRRNEVHRILMDSIVNENLLMFLQPVVNAKTNTVDGAEALCRLSDGNGGYIFPDEFIPMALNNGSMDALGHQMFRKACAFMSREDVKNSQLKWINVNVSPDQFQNPNLLDDFLAILNTYNLKPEKIHLEITEESMIDRHLLHDAMTRFRQKGFIFSMDDFGSSYSNMIRLQQNHFSNVKIDKDFTWSYFKNKTALLPDIIRTCHDLDMLVVAEGIETKDMADGIRAIHGDYLQGYYFSKPLPEKEFWKKYCQ